MNNPTRATVGVDVSTGWTSPDAPRDLDADAVTERPDVRRWLARLDAEGPAGRLGLHGRTVTQLVAGEPVQLLEESDGWACVVAPWQPAPEDARGYPAWVPLAHLSRRSVPAPWPGSEGLDAAIHIPDIARRHLGLPYLWGGTTPYGLDCSGLVHLSYRQAGHVVPRDAAAQQEAATIVALGTERAGDLYFFARPSGEVYHVGFVTAGRLILHASETDGRVVESTLTPERLASISSAGRLPAG